MIPRVRENIQVITTSFKIYTITSQAIPGMVPEFAGVKEALKQSVHVAPGYALFAAHVYDIFVFYAMSRKI